jgi:hypothetical protein
MTMLPTIRMGEPVPELPFGTPHSTIVMTPPPAAPTKLANIVAPAVSRTDLTGGEPWEQVRDYVVSQIEERWGPMPRNPIKEKAIFSSFANRYGDKAMPIARAACETHRCEWRSAPLSVSRFTKGCDPYFAEVLAQRV